METGSWKPMIISKTAAYPKGRYDGGWWSLNVLNSHTILFMGTTNSYELDIKDILNTGNDPTDKYDISILENDEEIPARLRLDDPENPSFWLEVGIDIIN